MNIRRMTLLVLTLTTILTASIMAVFLTIRTDSFRQQNTLQIYERSVTIMSDSITAMLIEDPDILPEILPALIREPMESVTVLTVDGTILASVQLGPQRDDLISSQGPSPQEGKAPLQSETIEYPLYDQSGGSIGKISIEKSELLPPPFLHRVFSTDLFGNFLIALLPALIITLILSIWFSRMLRRPLEQTAGYARSLSQGNRADSYDTLASRIDEISTIQESLMSLDSRLKIKQKSRKTLIDNMVHQSRTPLTILRMHLESIEDGIINLDGNEMQVLYSQIENITSVITNMSGMIDASKEITELNPERFSLNDLLQKVSGGFSAQFRKKQLQLTIESGPDLELFTDRFLLSQVLYNLMSNAGKYSCPGDSIRVSSSVDQNILSIAVADTGMGMDEHVREHIFDAYYRAKELGEIKGEGLGLFIVRENMSLLGGSIEVSSKKHEGSVFTVSLPLDIS